MTVANLSASAGLEALKLEVLKLEVMQGVEKRAKLIQEIVDSLFSFAELGFQETESERYMTGLLEKAGFAIRRGAAGIPTQWVATWGNRGPVISLNSDIDALYGLSQKPGVPYPEPLVEGAPGHGEGHNSGMAIAIVAALAAKDIMEREDLPGTLHLWPGIAEEQIASKSYVANSDVLDGVDVVLSMHVSNDFTVQGGEGESLGAASVEFTFHGKSAHAAGTPWLGRSALDAVELMNVGWNFKREHLHPRQRSHYVITYGGGQPNVVPDRASVWYYFRDSDADNVRAMMEVAHDIAAGAALMTGTSFKSELLGVAWPHHYNLPLAQIVHKNIEVVGMPAWTEDDIALAKALQKYMEADQIGLRTVVPPITPPLMGPTAGGSDDIGDVTWKVPTIRLRYPSNIPGAVGHHWSSAVSMATPIAYKGVAAAAKVAGMTIMDLILKPDTLDSIHEYFRSVQTKDVKYKPIQGPDAVPAIHLNGPTQAKYRPNLEKTYYNPEKFDTYLEQLGVKYPAT